MSRPRNQGRSPSDGRPGWADRGAALRLGGYRHNRYPRNGCFTRLLDLRKALDKLHRTNARLDVELLKGALERDAARRQREHGGVADRLRDPKP